MTALLEAIGVTKTFGGGVFQPSPTVALDDLSFKIETDSPAITAVVGESGSGKTTLARILLGETPPTAGTVNYLGKDLTKLSRSERRTFRRDVQVIFQDPLASLDPRMTVGNIIGEPLHTFHPELKRDASIARIQEMMAKVGLLPEMINRYPHEFSGGQAQRIGIARAMILNPKLIDCD